MNEPVKLVTNRPDAEVAATLKAEVIKAITPLCEIMDRAKADGFQIEFNLGQDFLGKACDRAASGCEGFLGP